ncbi:MULTISPECIES: class I SAM-dependent methyltransferase [Corallincola]|uniref:Ribosomal RNA small subunit methyltransferase J n=2 Tax=Corallincola TaxID=1775176 RepID=A0A368NL63_9GAMM|nr:MULTISPECIES: class I SAM-dependent methyltransferase [Corallincola]RCU50860.1 16S rRNA (guanine(1516)-N(2))-methyltransferase [Corallincola holothuriorum]TAA45819.1 16S rRNA (guanine(1516)-N(2))-methyltransferase [Corallincola spongiicola]
MPLPIHSDTPERRDHLQQLVSQWGFVPMRKQPDSGLLLYLDAERLSLKDLGDKKLGAVSVDFTDGAARHRRLHGGGRGEAVAKAVGARGQATPSVLDATAGLGRDAFVLASIGCQVTMLERSPVAAALLQDGLMRAQLDAEIGPWIGQRMRLLPGSAVDRMSDWQGDAPEVIYLDPMYPHRKKSAQVKKEMRLFQAMLGPDEDADLLLAPALALATKRVVVKRPDYAPPLCERKSDAQITTKTHRFDIYFCS